MISSYLVTTDIPQSCPLSDLHPNPDLSQEPSTYAQRQWHREAAQLSPQSLHTQNQAPQPTSSLLPVLPPQAQGLAPHTAMRGEPGKGLWLFPVPYTTRQSWLYCLDPLFNPSPESCPSSFLSWILSQCRNWSSSAYVSPYSIHSPHCCWKDTSKTLIWTYISQMWVQPLGREDPLEEGMATHSSILAWRIPRTEEPSGLQSMGSLRVGHSWASPHAGPTEPLSWDTGACVRISTCSTLGPSWFVPRGTPGRGARLSKGQKRETMFRKRWSLAHSDSNRQVMASGNDWTTKNHHLFISPGCTLETRTCGAQEAPPMDSTTDHLDPNLWG